VSVLCPGLVSTNLGETARISGVPEDRRREWFYLPPEMHEAAEAAAAGVLVADGIESNTFALFTHAPDAERFRTWRLDIEASLTEAIGASPAPPRFAD
jgi:hypothetical protein